MLYAKRLDAKKTCHSAQPAHDDVRKRALTTGQRQEKDETMTTPILFTHYGFSPYLSRTLRCATLTNGEARRILLGDKDNREVARQCGWEHFETAEIVSDLRRDFGAVFRPVRGKKYPLQINRGDYLKYVFERWFIVQKFCKDIGLDEFWHFDSDVMVLEPLESFAMLLRAQGIAYTKQCNDTCLNGFVTGCVVNDFCEYMISLFRDENFLLTQQKELDATSPVQAFTEMKAFDLFSQEATYRGRHLATIAPGWWFDDAICLENGFQMSAPNRYAKAYRKIKHVVFDSEKFLGFRGNEAVRFAALNCSWVHLGVFDWILTRVEALAMGKRLPASDISEARPDLRQRFLYALRDLKRGEILIRKF